jgi:integrase
MVRVPARLQTVVAAKKKFFARESVAKAYVERLARQLGDYHSQALGLSDRQKLEASECCRLLERENASLLEAVHHYLRYREQAKRSVPLSDMFEELLSIKRQDNVSQRYMRDLRSKVGRFVASHDNKLACDITPAVVERWIRSHVHIGAVSRESYRRNLSTFLEFGRRRGYSRSNPAADIRMRRRPEGEVTILGTEEVRALLSNCAPEIVPYVAICAFAGLRPSEAAALDWADIHFGAMQIEVRARRSKTRRYRLVPIQPNLAEWLTGCPLKSGTVYYSRRRFHEAYKAAGMPEWKMDVLRHSYGTYRLPILKSADALALEMGNSPDVIFRHYRRPVNEAAALAYFTIAPKNCKSMPHIEPQSDAADQSPRRNCSNAAAGIRHVRCNQTALKRRDRHNCVTVFGASVKRRATSSTVNRSRNSVLSKVSSRDASLVVVCMCTDCYP